jgi:hypothetical protein
MGIKYTKEILEPIIKECICVSDVMRKLGLRQSGGSHSYLSKKIKECGIDASHFLGKTLAKGKPSPRKNRGKKY